MALKITPLLLAFIATCGHFANCQQIPLKHQLSASQERLLEQIVKYNQVEGQYIGRMAARSEQYARFDSLNSISSHEDIILFTKHPSSIVRAYAFSALLKKKDTQGALKVLRYSVQDTSVIRHQFGCISGASLLGRYMYLNFYSFAKRNKLFITPKQRKSLDSLSERLPEFDLAEAIIARQLKDDK